MTRRQKRSLYRIIVAALLYAVVLLLPVKIHIKRFFYIVPYLVIGYDILINAVKGVLHGQPFDENFLMAIATVGAMVLGEYTEGAAVMLLYQIGELFQSCAVGKSRRSIAKLMEIKSDTANVEREDGTVEAVRAEEVSEGSVIVVKVGERIPVDGVVLSGTSTLDTSALTGESAPRDALPGSEVISGCINLTGLLKIKTTRRFEDSTVARILALVQTAGIRKARSEKFITRFARVYTPAVCIGALLLAVLPPVANIVLFDKAAMWSVWVYRALTFLVISCPCALVISVPLTFFSGIGGASRIGILLKGSNYIENLARVETVVFDKTGTLTEGSFSVSEIIPHGVSEEELLEFTAAAECFSLHPVSECIRERFKVDPSVVTDASELAGKGVICKYSSKTAAAGNAQLMHHLGVSFAEVDRPGTVVYTAVDGEYIGCIVVSDTVKSTAYQAVRAIKAAGVKKTVMLSGDRENVAKSVGEKLGIDKIYASLLPEQKVQKLELEMQSSRGLTAYVGDGINDAPVIMRADVGIAMGALGSQAAIEAADVVLMDDDPSKVAKCISISRKCMSIVWQNIIFAVGIKLICLVLGALGIANMWAAIFADVGVMILAVLNAIRAMFVK